MPCQIIDYVSRASDCFESTIGALQQVEIAIHDAADYHARG